MITSPIKAFTAAPYLLEALKQSASQPCHCATKVSVSLQSINQELALTPKASPTVPYTRNSHKEQLALKFFSRLECL